MNRNKLVPELIVMNLEKSKSFWIDLTGLYIKDLKRIGIE